MSFPPASDFWQVGIVTGKISGVIEDACRSSVEDRVVWLPDAGPWRYLADPFGLHGDDSLHVFVEAFDYRTKHAMIEHHEYGLDLSWREKSTALALPFHASYPFVLKDRGEFFMIPETHQAGEIALYRAHAFPGGWVRETALLRDVPGAEPSLLRHGGSWWMFFTIVGPKARDQRELHVAFADELTGPWQLHPQNPILDDRSGARPAGTPFVGPDGKVILPVQDCSRTYGGALRFLSFSELTRERISCSHAGPTLGGDCFSKTHLDGCHTLAECGEFTLIDVKRIDRSWTRYGVDLNRRLRRILQRKPVPSGDAA